MSARIPACCLSIGCNLWVIASGTLTRALSALHCPAEGLVRMGPRPYVHGQHGQ